MQGRGGPLEKYLAVPGANTNLPVSAGRQPVPLQFADDACAKFESFHCQLEGIARLTRAAVPAALRNEGAEA